MILSFLPFKAESDLRAKSLNKACFKASDCKNATNMQFFIEDLRKKAIGYIKFSNFASGMGKNLFSIYNTDFIVKIGFSAFLRQRGKI